MQYLRSRNGERVKTSRQTTSNCSDIHRNVLSKFQTMFLCNKLCTRFQMTKKIKKLEKETKTWKERWEGANKALLDMVTERSELEKHLDLQTKKNGQLQNLCRALQQQLTELRKLEKNKTG